MSTRSKFARIRPYSFKGITNRTAGDAALEGPQPSPPLVPEDISAALSALDTRLNSLYAAVPPRTALMIITGHSDPRRMAELNARKATFEAAVRSGKTLEDMPNEARWTSADGRALEEEVEKAKRGLLFLGIKDAK